jgi:RNA polymerase sigma-70 factor, ECF subfamily
MKQNEPELIARIMDGDKEAYAHLIDRYKDGLYHHCFRIVRDEDEAEDLAHEAFIAAYVHIDRYDPRFRFSTWLYKIATNLALSHLRKRREVRIDQDEWDKIPSNAPNAEQMASDSELHEVVDQLPLRYRTVVAMHYWQGKSYREIAAHLGVPVGSIKTWMYRAKKHLKEVLS